MQSVQRFNAANWRTFGSRSVQFANSGIEILQAAKKITQVLISFLAQSRSRFITRFSSAVGNLYNYSLDGLNALHDFAIYYGAFPFSVELSLPMTFSSDSFSRAICHMIAHRVYPLGSEVDALGGIMAYKSSHRHFLGPYQGYAVQTRPRTGQDRRRVDFRGLAMPVARSASTKLAETEKAMETIRVTYFGYKMHGDRNVTYAEDIWGCSLK